jgi:type IV secretion system protein VirB4
MMRSVLPWALPLDDHGTIFTKWGGLQRTARFRGIDDQSSSQQVQADFDSRINNVLKRVGGDCALWIDAIRRKSPPSVLAPRESFGTTASWVIEAERVDRYNNQQGGHLETECQITYARMLPKDRQFALQNLVIQNGPKTAIGNYREFHRQFGQEIESFANALRQCEMPGVELLNTDETLTYLHSCVSNHHQSVKALDWGMPVDDMLADCDLVPGIAPTLGGHHVRVVSVLAFPGHTYPTMLAGLDALGFEYRACWRWLPFDSTETDDFLDAVADRWKRARKGLRSILWEAWTKRPAEDLDGTAVERGNEVEAVASVVRNDLVSLGHLTLTITVMDKDEVTADERAAKVLGYIQGRSMTGVIETYNTVEALIGSWPGHPFANIRRRVVTSMNLAHLVRTTAKWSGPKRNDHLGGAPLITCSTGERDPFRFNPWVQDVGHVNIFGPNGSGKSTLGGLWAHQFMRYEDACVRIFEQGRSARIPTLAAGGLYYTLDTESLSFQPLRYIDSLPERIWARDWLCDRVEQAGVAVDPGIRNRVWTALESLAAIKDADLRSMTGFVQLLRSEAKDDPVKAALQDFTTGAYAHWLNGKADPLALNNRWITFEMGNLLKAPRAAGAVLSYIFHRLESMFDGRPTLIFLDEGWQFLLVGEFAKKIREWLKTLRKRNVSVVFASQEIADSVKSPQASTLISECLTKIYLANGEARSPEIRPYYRDLGLRDDQIDRIGAMVPKRDYFVVSRDGSRVFDLDMDGTPVGLSICGASSDKHHKMADEVLAKYGTERFFEGWMVKNGFYDVIDALEQNQPAAALAAE